MTEPLGSAGDTRLQSFRDAYRRRVRGGVALILVMALVLVLLAMAGTVLGAASFSPAESWQALWNRLWGGGASTPTLADEIVWQLRVPRVLMAIVGGMALALGGLLLQTILRNPLASPYTLGISSAASFGAALAIVLRTSVLSLGLTLPYDYLIVVNAFLFALLSTAAVYFLTRVQRVTPETIVLLGIAMMFLFTALTSLVQFLGDPDDLAPLAYWMFGSLNRSNWEMLGVTTVVTVVGALLVFRWAWDLNALNAGDESAISSGVHVARARLKGMVVASLLTATVVSFLGPIGFIGLVGPHLARMLIGGDHRLLIPMSLTLGAGLLLVADIVARTVIAPVVIPVGIITAFVGVPTLIFLMLRRKAEHW